jgi:hypothetical protein
VLEEKGFFERDQQQQYMRMVACGADPGQIACTSNVSPEKFLIVMGSPYNIRSHTP